MDVNAPEVLVWFDLADRAVNFRQVAVPLADVAGRTGLHPADVDLAVAAIGAEGLASAWDAGGGVVATLTTLAAGRLGLKLRRVSGGMAGLAWMPLDARERRERYRPSRTIVEAGLDGLRLDALAGGEPRPELVAMATEAVEALAPRPKRRQSDRDLDARRLPRPTVRLYGCQPWPAGWRDRCEVRPSDPRRRKSRLVAVDPAPLARPQGICPACQGARMKSAAHYCLACDRWGLDWLLARILDSEARAVVVGAEESFAERMNPAASA